MLADLALQRSPGSPLKEVCKGAGPISDCPGGTGKVEISRWSPGRIEVKIEEPSSVDRPAPFIDFDGIEEERFIAFCAHAVALARRWVVMSCEWRYVASLERAGLPLVRFGIWHKLDGAP
jgi:hypothetical protein